MVKPRPTTNILQERFHRLDSGSGVSPELRDAWNRILAIDAALADLKSAIARIELVLRRD